MMDGRSEIRATSKSKPACTNNGMDPKIASTTLSTMTGTAVRTDWTMDGRAVINDVNRLMPVFTINGMDDIKKSTTAFTMVGRAAIKIGKASSAPVARPSTSCIAASRIKSILPIRPETMVTTAATAVGIKSGKADPRPEVNATTICTAASTTKGKLSSSAEVTVNTAMIATGVNSGNRLRIVLSTCSNRLLTDCSTIGSNSPMAVRMVPTTVGKTDTMFSRTGTTLSLTALNASTMFWVKFCISASALPSPAMKDSMDAFIRPMEPEMVCVASLSKLPAYCWVCSKK